MKSKLKKTIALVLVGGSGERFGKEKQFVLALNRPLMSFAIEELGLSPYIDEIVLVGKKGTLNKTLEIGKAYANNKLKAVIEGGKTRQESSYKGVKFLIDSGFSSDSIVLIQDGYRPNITQEMIKENVESAKINKAAVTAIKEPNSVFISNNDYKVNSYLDRNEIYEAQTPQTFELGLIYKAHLKGDKRKGISDDASLVRLLKKDIAIVPGDKNNIKINYVSDLNYFEYIKGGLNR